MQVMHDSAAYFMHRLLDFTFGLFNLGVLLDGLLDSTARIMRHLLDLTLRCAQA
jgi:hypothetical protein